jgi:hypothetical protein
MQPRKHEDAKKKIISSTKDFFFVLSCLRGQRRTELSGRHDFKFNVLGLWQTGRSRVAVRLKADTTYELRGVTRRGRLP